MTLAEFGVEIPDDTTDEEPDDPGPDPGREADPAHEHPCQKPDCPRPAHAATSYTYCSTCVDISNWL